MAKNNAPKTQDSEEKKNQVPTAGEMNGAKAGDTTQVNQPEESEMLLALREQAIELGMSEKEAEAFTDEKVLEITVNALQDARAKLEKAESRAVTAEGESEAKTKEIERVASLIERPNPAEEKTVEKNYISKAQRMREKLEAQPKVRVLLPIVGDEKPGIVREVEINGRKEQMVVGGEVEVVQLNGFKTFIPKGQYVEVPQQVADELNQALVNTQMAGEEFLIDRIDPRTGQPVRNQL